LMASGTASGQKCSCARGHDQTFVTRQCMHGVKEVSCLFLNLIFVRNVDSLEVWLVFTAGPYPTFVRSFVRSFVYSLLPFVLCDPATLRLLTFSTNPLCQVILDNSNPRGNTYTAEDDYRA